MNLIQPIEINVTVTYKLIDRFAPDNIEKTNERKSNLNLGVYGGFSFTIFFFLLE